MKFFVYRPIRRLYPNKKRKYIFVSQTQPPQEPTVAVPRPEIHLEYPQIYPNNVCLDDFCVDEEPPQPPPSVDFGDEMAPETKSLFQRAREKFPHSQHKLKPPPIVNHRGEITIENL